MAKYTADEMAFQLREMRKLVLFAAQHGSTESYEKIGKDETQLVTEAMEMGFTIKEIGDAQTGRWNSL